MRRIITIGPALIVLATASSLLWVSPRVLRTLATSQTEAQILLAQRTIETDDILERLNRAIRAVADSVEPSVVHIDVMSPEAGRRRMQGATGSGWIYDAKGHIITNAHVVRASKFVRVQLHDGRASQATIVGIDPFTDIAVLKIEATDLVPVARASGERLFQGDRVFAFGSPFGFKFSMSEGIVSGLGRAAGPALDSGGFTNFIQTDAAVNPGNSGGPLVDVRGRVVGMNVAIATAKDNLGSANTEGQNSGISFAIPLATIENVAQQIIENGKVSRGFLGISFGGRRFFDDDVIHGGVPVGVSDGGPAAKGGLRNNDLISTINGNAVTSLEVMRSLISNSRPGETVSLGIIRDGESKTIPVTMGEMPTTVLIGRGGIIGDIEEDLGIVFDVDSDAALVHSVRESSLAEDAGFKEGDRIIRVGERDVANVVEAVAALIDSGLYSGKTVQISTRNAGAADSPAQRLSVKLWSMR